MEKTLSLKKTLSLIRFNYLIISLFVLALLFLGTINVNASSDTCSSLLLFPDRSVSILTGEQIEIIVVGRYSDNTVKLLTDKAVFSSSNESVAKVSNGKIIAGTTIGTAKISASYNEKVQTLSVTVRNTKAVKSLTLSSQSINLGAGKTQALDVYANYIDGTNENVTNNAQTIYSSSNTAVATVNKNVIQAVGSGTAKITAYFGDKTATCSVKVMGLNKIIIEPTSMSIFTGEYKTVKVYGVYEDLSKQDITSSASLTSSNSDIVKCTPGSASITGIAKGSATITAVFNDKKAKFTVKVENPKDISSLTVSKEELIMSPNTQETIVVKANFYDQVNNPSQDVTSLATYKVSYSSYASVDKGVITAKKNGYTTITISYNGKSTSCRVRVGDAQKITVSPKSLTLFIGEVKTISVSAAYSNSTNNDAAKFAEYNTNTSGIVDATTTKGQIKGIAKGTVVITISYGNQKATCTVIVKDPEGISKLYLSSSKVTISKGNTAQLNTYAKYESSNTKDITTDAEISYSNSDNSIATIDNKGLITAGTKSGYTTITVTYKGNKVKCSVHVL